MICGAALSVTRRLISAGLRFAGQAADFDQVESERLELGQQAVWRGLVRDGASQQRVLAFCLGVQGGERAQHRRTQVAADTDLVGRRRRPVALLPGHCLAARPGARARTMPAKAKMHRAARTMDSASTAAKSPMNSEATPTPTTGMIRPE